MARLRMRVAAWYGEDLTDAALNLFDENVRRGMSVSRAALEALSEWDMLDAVIADVTDGAK